MDAVDCLHEARAYHEPRLCEGEGMASKADATHRGEGLAGVTT
jgi:hypothetical protein